MAFRNYLAPNTYTVVDSVFYERKERIRFAIYIYTDSTRENFLANREFTVDRLYCYDGVKKINVKTPPENPQKGDAYLTDAVNLLGAFIEHPLQRAVWNGSSWDFWIVMPFQIIYCEANNRYYQRDGDALKIIQVSSDQRIFDRFFSPDMVYNLSNTTKQAYEYLKTLPEFFNCEDV